MAKPGKTIQVDAETEKLLRVATVAIENALDEDGDFELSTDAHDAVRCLTEVRRLFYGTPIEKMLTHAIVVCDLVAEKAAG